MSSFWYDQYLKSPHWRALRQHTLERFRHQCSVCGRNKSLNVHHLTYKRDSRSVMYREIDAELIVLCRFCHQTWHKVDRLDRAFTSKLHTKIDDKLSSDFFSNKPKKKLKKPKQANPRHRRIEHDSERMLRNLYGLDHGTLPTS